MANVLPRKKQLAVLSTLVEGNSVRSTERLTGVHRDTILRLMVRVGDGCASLLDAMMRNLSCRRLELDELWAFVGKKQRHFNAEKDDFNRVGDAWTFVAIDPETKLVPAFLTGKRDVETTNAFVADLAKRLRYQVQISTDGLAAYVGAISSNIEDAHYAQVIKSYEADIIGPGRYSPPKVTSIEKKPIMGEPVAELVSTSLVERQNLTMRMGIRRFTRLTNAFSKKLENHVAATALHFGHYNLVRRHSTLRTTPAMAAGVTTTMWSMDELVSAALDGVRP